MIRRDTNCLIRFFILDFVDSLLCAYSIGDKILTFDKKLIKCIYANKGQLLVE